MPTFQALRRNAGYTQETLAVALNIDRSTVGKWEIGAAYPRIPQLRKMAELLNCSVQTILDALEQNKTANDND